MSGQALVCRRSARAGAQVVASGVSGEAEARFVTELTRLGAMHGGAGRSARLSRAAMSHDLSMQSTHPLN